MADEEEEEEEYSRLAIASRVLPRVNVRRGIWKVVAQTDTLPAGTVSE